MPEFDAQIHVHHGNFAHLELVRVLGDGRLRNGEIRCECGRGVQSSGAVHSGRVAYHDGMVGRHEHKAALGDLVDASAQIWKCVCGYTEVACLESTIRFGA